jgi:hypothetical protein
VRDTNAHADGYSYCYSNGYSDSYGYRNCDCDANGHTNSYGYRDTDSNSDCHGNINTNADAYLLPWRRYTRAVGASSAGSDRSLRGIHGQQWDLCL